MAPISPTYSDDDEYTEAFQNSAAVIFSMIDTQVKQEFQAHQTKVENEQVLAANAIEAVAAVTIGDAGPDATALDAGVDPLSQTPAALAGADGDGFGATAPVSAACLFRCLLVYFVPAV